MNAVYERDELLRLLNRLTAGIIEPDQQERLEAILQTCPEARKDYFAFLDVDLGLREMALCQSAEIPPRVGLPDKPSSTANRAGFRSRVAFRGYALAAAVVAMVLLVLLYAQRSGGPDPESSPRQTAVATEVDRPSSDYIATLIFADECRWEHASKPLLEGQRLPIGELHLLEGVAMVRFDGGAVAVLSGEVRLALESRGSVRLYQGRLTVQAPDEAVGFTVRTPENDLVDLGTEFAVEVDRGGATELHVLDGAVEYRKPTGHPGSGQLIRGGQAVRFEKGAEQAHSVTVNAKRLKQLLIDAKPKPREDLLTVYEGFQYELGSLPLRAADGGWGWQGPWRLRRSAEGCVQDPDSTTSMSIAFQKLNVPWPIRGGRAGMLEMPPGDNYRVRKLAEPVDLRQDAVYYVSLMIREGPLPAETDSQQRQRESARLTFRSSADYWGDRVSFGLPAGRRPHIELADFIRFTGAPVPEGQTLLWVSKIVARRHGEDEVFFRVYQEGESLDIVEPADWSLVTRGFRSDLRLDLLVLTSTGETCRWFDEFRIGTSWRAVVPIAQRTTIQSTPPAS